MTERFTVMECIGETALGDTYLLSENNTDDSYILKARKDFEAAATNEAELLHGLQHKGLPEYEKTIEQDGVQYTLRRYVEGKPLDEYITSMETSEPEKVVDSLISLCDVLKYLHSQPEPIIHRDIKPSNIIINPENNAVTLIDFGISRKYQENAANDTVYLGTHKFAPPEQYGFAQTDARTDIYSIGVVMRYWLSGTTDESVKIKDRVLERIVSKCTELKPSMRYQSADSLKKALVRYKHRVRRCIVGISACLATAAIITTLIYATAAGLFIPPSVVDDIPPVFQTPVGYNDAEYQQLVAFFLYEDNLEKIRAQHSGFDIEIPATWYWEKGETWIADDGTEHPLVNFVAWAWGRVEYMHLSDIGLTGVLDVSGFDQLQTLDVPNNNLAGINLSGCISLSLLQVDRDIHLSLDLSGLPNLEYVNSW
jgi:hypothetical protein